MAPPGHLPTLRKHVNVPPRVRRSRLSRSIAAAALVIAACAPEPTGIDTAVPDPVLLEDVIVATLPSPYYHFEYDSTQRVRFASFASDLTRYDVTWTAGRIGEMKNNSLGNTDRLQYVYDADGRVSLVKYFDGAGQLFVVVALTYDGARLASLQRDRRLGDVFVIDKIMTFAYYPDGNLETLTVHRPAVDGYQPEATYATRFEGYDAKRNVDGFSLLHDDFFDHLVLLPGVTLQVNNPAREIRTGDGLNYSAEFTYTYDALDRPTAKVGTATVTNGSDPGTFPLRTDFTYYH